ncbi:MAG: hypothetical protein HYX32_14925 [Actinobacteria bacterium]|nr:hypothetical protein [Actinomycetota bacterium]
MNRRLIAGALFGSVILAACGSTRPSGAGNGTTPAAGSSPAGTAAPGSPTGGTTRTTRVPAKDAKAIVLNGQGNNLDAYETDPPFQTQRVIKTVADDPNGLDINAQLCLFPDGSKRFIAGEDTGQSSGNTQGWGIFQMSGDSVGTLAAEEVGKVVPTYQGSADNAENYGCGFLSDQRLLLTDVGSQALGPADGQLIVWFPPFRFKEGNRYCKIDVDIATAQSIWVDSNDDVYVASARPSDEPNATTAGVWKYSPPFPTSDTAAGGCGRKDATGAPLADTVKKERVITPGTNGLVSPAGLAPAPNGNLYVSSVFSGVINEYNKDGTFVRTILQPPAGETLGAKPYSTGTPLGIGVAPDGSLFYADIGLVVDPAKGPGPGDRTGSVRKIRFVDGEPQPPETMATNLDFPDGIGIYLPG